MTGDPPAVKRWIARFAAEHVTSAQEQRRQRDAFRAHGGPGKPFAMFLLTPDGYRYLSEQLPSPGVGEFTVPEHEMYFPAGMKRRPEQPGQLAQPALSLALAKEPGPADRFGSFMVFRKLEQNVKAFREAIARLSSEPGISPEDAGAMAVGRFENGEPALPDVEVKVPGADKNDFQYDQDLTGARCPFHAHIRKTNPRGDVPRVRPPEEFERAKRIVHQFVLQQDGSDSNNFVKAGVGFDAVIGQHNGLGPEPKEQTWPTTTGTVKFKMVNFVRMRGGEYFFAPSMAFLHGLAQA